MDNEQDQVQGEDTNNFFSVTNAEGGGMQAGYSPFQPPNEEQVFINREAEKQKKKESKEAAKYLKIWDKKTATSRMPLKRVKDGDIQMMDGELLHNYNKTQRGYISAAAVIAKSRVQFPRESRPQNINEFVDQKKEMFLVELSYNTIKEEIIDLELKRNAKREALSDSSNQLEKDNKKLVDFIENDNLTTQNDNKAADDAHQERKNKELQIRTIDTNIQNVKSDIDKNIDQLNALEHHKQFLFGIFERENPHWVEKLKEERERKLKKIRDKWLETVKYTGIMEEDEYSEAASKAPDVKSVSSPGKKGGKDKKQYSDAELIEIFNKRLANDQIDVGVDFYDEEVLFKDPEELMILYSYLEDGNRKQILEIGDITEEIDQQKQRGLENQERIGGEIQNQLTVKKKLEEQIATQSIILNELKKQSQLKNQANDNNKNAKKKQEEEEELDIDALLQELKTHIIAVYGNLPNSGKDPQEMAGKQPINILHEIELDINTNIKTISYIMENDQFGKQWEPLVAKFEGQRKLHRFEERKRQSNEQDRIIKAQKQAENEKKQTKIVKKIGKKQMYASDKPKVKHVEKKVVIDPDTADQIRYLGGDFNTLHEQALEAEQLANAQD